MLYPSPWAGLPTVLPSLHPPPALFHLHPAFPLLPQALVRLVGAIHCGIH